MAGPSPPSPPAARPSISRASARRSTASTRSPPCDLDAVEAAIGEATAGILIEPIMGEGGMREVSWAFLRDLRALVRREGHSAPARRGADRHGPHRAPVRPSMGRHHAGHHGDRQGPRRRLSGRRLPHHGGGRLGHDARAATARPSVATRSPWRSAMPCSTWCWSPAFSTMSATMGLRLKQRLAALKDEHRRHHRGGARPGPDAWAEMQGAEPDPAQGASSPSGC